MGRVQTCYKQKIIRLFRRVLGHNDMEIIMIFRYLDHIINIKPFHQYFGIKPHIAKTSKTVYLDIRPHNLL
jgi:hypothetical protein